MSVVLAEGHVLRLSPSWPSAGGVQHKNGAPFNRTLFSSKKVPIYGGDRVIEGPKSCQEFLPWYIGTSTVLCVCVCVFIKLHITAQSGLVILVILCHSR